MIMDIRAKVEQLSARMHDHPQYPTQGAVLFVDLERREHFSKYLDTEVFRTFLTGRGANMHLLYNLLLEGRTPLDPQIPLVFGSGALTGSVPTATRGNVSSISPDGLPFYVPPLLKRPSSGTGILTCFPSPTPFGLGLGID